MFFVQNNFIQIIGKLNMQKNYKMSIPLLHFQDIISLILSINPYVLILLSIKP